jgi:predicted Zn-dependent protease
MKHALFLLALAGCAQNQEHAHLSVSCPMELSAATSDAIADWNQAVGHALFELTTDGDVTISLGETTGYPDAIGLARGNDITITGVMPFETIRHELGHVLGIGHESDEHSVMNQYIRPETEITGHSIRYAEIVWESL